MIIKVIITIIIIIMIVYCMLQLLQLQPEMEIVHEFIQNDDFKYLKLLGTLTIVPFIIVIIVVTITFIVSRLFLFADGWECKRNLYDFRAIVQRL